MSKRLVKVNAPLKKASQEDVNRGWIRISEELRGGISSRAYVEVEANNRKIWCQVLGTPGEHGCVKMSEWYREFLGWTELPVENVHLTLREVGRGCMIKAWSYHPDDIVRVGICLGFISMALGLLSCIFAFVPMIPDRGFWLPTVVAALVSLSVGLVITGIRILISKVPRRV